MDSLHPYGDLGGSKSSLSEINLFLFKFMQQTKPRRKIAKQYMVVNYEKERQDIFSVQIHDHYTKGLLYSSPEFTDSLEMLKHAEDLHKIAVIDDIAIKVSPFPKKEGKVATK